MKNIIFFIVILLSIIPQRNLHCEWIQMSSGIGANKFITSFISNNNYIFAGTSTDGVFRSSDNGLSWTVVNKDLSNLNITSLYIINNSLYAGTFGGGIFISSDFGSNWIENNNGLSNLFVSSIFSRDNIIFVGTSVLTDNTGGVYYSTNYGLSWIFSGLQNLSIKTFTKSNNVFLAGTGNGGGVYRSTNNGINWINASGGLFGYSLDANSISSNGTNIYLGTGNGVYLSINYGTNWNIISIGLPNLYVNSLSLNNARMFIGTNNGVYVTTNYGTNWFIKNEGFQSAYIVKTIYETEDYVFAGTSGHSVWRRNLNEIISVKKISTNLPNKFALFQNYPNPFNSTTKIKFSIPKSTLRIKENGLVKLNVFDITGREVTELVNEVLQPGMYEVNFDGKNLPSGIYFYKLTTSKFSETKKMLMVK